jgi:hypothetical protein
VTYAARTKAKYVSLVQDVLSHQPDAGTHSDRGDDIKRAMIDPHNEILAEDVCRRCY